MCNHYRKKREVIEWAADEIPDVSIPLPFDEVPEHTYPKYPAPVVIQEGATRSMVTKVWGIPMTVKGATKALTRYVTNARNDKLTGYTWGQSTRHRRCLIPAPGYFGQGPAGAKGRKARCAAFRTLPFG